MTTMIETKDVDPMLIWNWEQSLISAHDQNKKETVGMLTKSKNCCHVVNRPSSTELRPVTVIAETHLFVQLR